MTLEHEPTVCEAPCAQPTAPTCVVWGWCFDKGVLCTCLGSKGHQLCYMCMRMRPYMAETAVHGCHYLGQEPIGLLPGWYGCAYARLWIGVWACHLLLLFEKSYLSCRLCQMCVNSHNKKRMTHPLRVAKNCTTHPLTKGSKTDDPPPLCSGPLPPPPPPILFDQSLSRFYVTTIQTIFTRHNDTLFSK